MTSLKKPGQLRSVLTSLYKARRKKIIEVFKFLVSRSNIKLGQAVKKAIDLFETTKLDMADCLIAVYSLRGKLASFDKELLSVEGVKKYW